MNDIGPFQDIIEVGWKIIPTLAVVRMVYVHPDAIDLIGSPEPGLIGPAALMSAHAVSPFDDGDIQFGLLSSRTLNSIPFGDVSEAVEGSPGSFSLWIDMNAVLEAFAAVPPTEDPENPGVFIDPVIPEEIAFDLFGLVSDVVDNFAIPVAIEVTVYGGRTATPIETFLPVAFNDFSVVNPGGRLTGRSDTTLRKTMGPGYQASEKGEFITQVILGTELASIRFPADEVEETP